MRDDLQPQAQALMSYRPRLDGLRCVAIGLVLNHHFGGVLASFFDGGYYGVDLFFVISGYLITTLLLRDPRTSFGAVYKAFVGRRALRIFPAYYALLLVLLLFGVDPAREMIVSLASYTFNYAATLRDLRVDADPSVRENPLYYLWSLSVEEQFYLLWPPIVIGFRRRKGLLLGITALVVILGYSQLLFGIVPRFRIFNYTGLFNRMGSLGMGALGAVYAAWRGLPAPLFKSRLAELAALGMLAAALATTRSERVVVLGVASLFLVLKAAHFEFRLAAIDRMLTAPAVTYIGTISYGIYLFHVPLGLLLSGFVVNPIWTSIPFEHFGPLAKLRWHSWVLKLPLYSAMSIAVAALSYRYFETRILALKDRFFGYRGAPAPDGADGLTSRTTS